MTASDFAAWVAHIKATRSWSEMEISRQLGCGENQIRTWKVKGAPGYIGWACAAISYGLPPWRNPERS